MKNAVIGNDWRSEEEKKLNFNPLYHFVSGILYPIDHSKAGFLEKNNNLSDDTDSFQDENEEEIESNINSKSSNLAEDRDNDPLE